MLQALKIKNLGVTTKTQYGAVAGLVVLLLGVGIWILSVGQNSEVMGLTEAACAYDITDTGDDLVPSVDGKRIGTFERHGDGTVQLTLGNGFSPKANACIEKSGFSDRISTIRKYR